MHLILTYAVRAVKFYVVSHDATKADVKADSEVAITMYSFQLLSIQLVSLVLIGYSLPCLYSFYMCPQNGRQSIGYVLSMAMTRSRVLK